MELDEIDADDDLGAAIALFDQELRRLGVYDDMQTDARPGILTDELRRRLAAAGEEELYSEDLATLMAWHDGVISIHLPRELTTLDQGLAAMADARADDVPFGDQWFQVGRDMGGGRFVMDCGLNPSPLYLRHPEYVQSFPWGMSFPQIEAIAHLFRLWVFCYEKDIYGPFEGYVGGTATDLQRCEVLRGSPFWHFF